MPDAKRYTDDELTRWASDNGVRPGLSDGGAWCMSLHAARRIADSAYAAGHAAGRGEVDGLVKALETIDSMPVDGVSPFVVESMLRQAKSLAYSALSAHKKGAGDAH